MLEQKIKDLITPHLEYLGYEVVKVNVPKMGTRYKVEVLIDKLDGTKPTIDDCKKASQRVSVILDVEDPIKAQYTLEVSSPGIDRPLVKPSDYQKFKGYKIHLNLLDAVEGRRRFVGFIKDASDKTVIIEYTDSNLNEEKEALFDYGDIRSAKLDLDFVIKKEKLL